MKLLTILAGLLAFTGQAIAAGLPYELASRRAAAAPETVTGPGGSRTPFFSADGARLYFTSDLAGPGLEAAGPGTPDAFRRVPATGALELLSPRLPGVALERLGVVVTAASTNDQFVLLEGGGVLTDGDTNGTGDIFVRDTVAGVTHLVSVNAAGTGAGNEASGGAVMTPDARLVLFESRASDLVAGDTNGAADVLLRDRQTAQTTLLSRGPAGQAASPSSPVMLAPDGLTAIFTCAATNLAAAPDDGVPTDLHFWTPGGLRRLGLPPPAPGRLPRPDVFPTTTGHAVSADGRMLAFRSDGFNWDTGVGNLRIPPAAWRLDLATGRLTRLAEEVPSAPTLPPALPGDIRSILRADLSADGSRVALEVVVVAPDGVGSRESIRIWDGDALRTLEELVLTLPPVLPAPASLSDGMLSPDGSRLAFISHEPDVVAGAPGGEWELYVRDLATGQTRALSAPGGNFRGEVDYPETAFSPAGDQVAFVSEADGLAAGDANREGDIFLADVTGGPLRLLSAWPAAAGVRAPAGWSSFSAQAISGDGQQVLFSSASDEIRTGDTNGAHDIFAFDRPTGQVLLVSANTNGAAANAASSLQQVSADGRLVLFSSRASDVAPGDTNRANDVFVRDLQNGTSELISRSPRTGGSPERGAYARLMSRNGRTVIFSPYGGDYFPGPPAIPGRSLALADRATGLQVPVGTNRPPVYSVALSHDGEVAVALVASSGPGGGAGVVRATAGGGWAWQPLALPATPTTWGELALSHDGQILAIVTGQAPQLLILTNLATGEAMSFPPTGGGAWSFRDLQLTPAGGHLLARGPAAEGSGNHAWYRLDFAARETRTLNLGPDGRVFDFSSPVMDDSGRRIVFRSLDDGLVPGDRNGVMDVFLLEPATGLIALLSRGPDGRSAYGHSQTPAISGDGRWVAFSSTAALVPGDANAGPDVYVAPLDALLPLRLLAARRHADGSLRLPWRGPDGPARRLLAADAVGGPWLPAGGEFPAGAQEGEFTVPADGTAKRFFKVEER
ncbi:MAG: hypothetical protein ACKVYV_14765 [Limisphaerales bacterium]